MRNFSPAALAIADDIYKEDHFRNIIEKHCASVKTLLVNLRGRINYDININNEDSKMLNNLSSGRFYFEHL